MRDVTLGAEVPYRYSWAGSWMRDLIKTGDVVAVFWYKKNQISEQHFVFQVMNQSLNKKPFHVFCLTRLRLALMTGEISGILPHYQVTTKSADIPKALKDSVSTETLKDSTLRVVFDLS